MAAHAPTELTSAATLAPVAPPAPLVLAVDGLRVAYRAGGDPAVDVVRGVDLEIRAGEVVALVGESGSGKSTIAHAVVGLLAGSGTVTGGTITLGPGAGGADAHRARADGKDAGGASADEAARPGGLDLTALPHRAWQGVRGRRIGLVPQDPAVALNPVARIGDQVAEVLRIHRIASRAVARARAIAILEAVGLDHPEARARQYPHELSGGMRQRVLIGIALACEPELVIADEPTSALDVTVQRKVLDLLEELTARTRTAVLLITHDLAVAADRADRVVVLKDGLVVEHGPTTDVLDHPQHPYTRQLLAAAPSLAAPVPRSGAAARVVVADRAEPTGAAPADVPLLDVVGLTKTFRLPGGRGADSSVHAVDDVSFTVQPGRTLALVGESGSGKSTTARLVLGLETPTAGEVRFDGSVVAGQSSAERRELRRRSAFVHQNPYASLEPRFTVGQVVDEPLRSQRAGSRAAQSRAAQSRAAKSRAERRARVVELLDLVRLPAGTVDRRPDELSGGQRQRVAIARALALSPELVVLDEPTSALDVSVQAQILDLLAALQAEHHLAYLFISHDLAVVRQVADEVAVMQAGRILELGTADDVFARPTQDYTRELLAAVPGTRRAHPPEGLRS